MPALNATQKQSVERVLDLLQRIIDCYKRLDPQEQKVPPPWVAEVQRYVNALRALNAAGKIDIESKGMGILAHADYRGIHLNDKFGGDFTNDYQMPGDYQLDDCENGYFYSAWRLVEILFHEYYHYEKHSGWRALPKAFIILTYGTVGNLVEGLYRLTTKGPHLRRKYAGHEHHAYSRTRMLLGALRSMLFWIYMNEDREDPCLPCARRHEQEAQTAAERQNPYEWVR